jgi:hypothetical protein
VVVVADLGLLRAPPLHFCRQLFQRVLFVEGKTPRAPRARFCRRFACGRKLRRAALLQHVGINRAYSR